jgi:valyl-tRNA synthetase
MNRVEGYRNFCNKLWNASRYVLTNCEGQDVGLNGDAVELSVVDRWIISRLQRTEQAVISALEDFRFDLAAQALYEFTWNEYCDWYLELTKPVLTGEGVDAAAKRGTRRTLVRVLETLLRLLHPLMPFITETIWQRAKVLATKNPAASLMVERFPVPDASRIDEVAEADVQWLKDVIMGLRNIRGELGVSPGKAVNVVLQKGGAADRERVGRFEAFLRAMARIDDVTWLDADEEPPMAAAALVGELTLLVPLKGLVDVQAEVARLGKEIDRLQQDVARQEAKLGNESFVARAPADVVAKERQKLEDNVQAVRQLTEQMKRIQAL